MGDIQPDGDAVPESYWERLPFLRDGEDHGFVTNPSYAARSIEGIVLRVGSAKAEIWSLPVQVSQGENGLVQDDVMVDTFFPAGCLSVVICSMSDSYNPLPFAYRVYLDNYKSQRPLNSSVDGIFDQIWMGNIVVVKYARGKSDERLTYANIQRGEDQLVLYILGDWLSRMWNGMFEKKVDP